jgi:cell division protein FtsB
VSAKRVAWAIGIVLAVLWALQGGEYGTTDLFRQRARRAALRAEVDSLAKHVDSLRAYKRALQTDPALQERIAREEFGMVRGERELLYRFGDVAPGDSGDAAGSGSPAAAPPRVVQP